MINSGIGANIKSLNQGALAALAIPLPPKAEQAQIVDHLEVLNAETKGLESSYQCKLAALDELRKSLLRKAFSGAL
jgi:type I restriction enzyme S subunit